MFASTFSSQKSNPAIMDGTGHVSVLEARFPAYSEEGESDCSAWSSSGDEREGTLLEVLTAIRFAEPMRAGQRYELEGTDGQATLKVYADYPPSSHRLVIVLESIVVRRRLRRRGVATEFIHQLTAIFRGKLGFSSLMVEAVQTPAMAALCRKEAMMLKGYAGDCFCVVFA